MKVFVWVRGMKVDEGGEAMDVGFEIRNWCR